MLQREERVARAYDTTPTHRPVVTPSIQLGPDGQRRLVRPQSPHQPSSDMTCQLLEVHGGWMWCVNLVANGLVSCPRPVTPRKVLAAHVLQVQGSVPAATACTCMRQHHEQ